MSVIIITPQSQPQRLPLGEPSSAVKTLLTSARKSGNPDTARMLRCLAVQVARMQQRRHRHDQA